MMRPMMLLLLAVAVIFIATSNAFMFSHQPKCGVSVFKGGKDFDGDKIMANKSFVPYLKSIGAVAKSCKVKVHVTDSYKQLKSPNEFVLSRELPLVLGRAIQFDLKDLKGGTMCNKLCMVSRSWKTLPDAACFINGVQKKGIKFTEPNLLDDGTTAKLSSAEADALKVATQKLCAPKTKAPKG